MGKLFLSRLTILTCLLLTVSLQGQEGGNYCVFQVEGKPMLNDSLVLAKGMFVYPDAFLTLDEGDKVLLTDDEGVMYEIKKKVTLPYGRIGHYTKKESQSPFTLTYLKYIWKKLWEKEEKENIGVVFRAPNYTAQITPLDSVQIFMPEITFSWEAAKAEEMQYFYLQETDGGSILKMATNGNTLILPVGGALIRPGGSYRWAITPENDLSSEYLQFSSFELLDEKSFEEKMKELNGARMEFMTLGLSEEEIKQTFCEDKKLCFN